MATNKFRWSSFLGTRNRGGVNTHATLTPATVKNKQPIHLQMSATKTLCFKKNYRFWCEPIFKSRLRGWDHSRKLNCDSSFTINLNNFAIKQRHHEICTSQRHFIIYIWWLAKKLPDLSKGKVIYSCGEVLGGLQTILSPVSPTCTLKPDVAFTWLLLGEKFHSSMQLSQFLCYLWNTSCSCFSFLWVTPVAIGTHSHSVIQQVWQSPSQVLHSR